MSNAANLPSLSSFQLIAQQWAKTHGWHTRVDGRGDLDMHSPDEAFRITAFPNYAALTATTHPPMTTHELGPYVELLQVIHTFLSGSVAPSKAPRSGSTGKFTVNW